MSAVSALAHRLDAAPLGEDERRALALHDADGARYGEIAHELGIDADAVGPLLLDARLRVREAVRGRPAPSAGTAECRRARPLLVARVDGEPVAPADAAWLKAHVAGCDECRATRIALREASLAIGAVMQAGELRLTMPPAPSAPVAPVARGVARPAPRRARRRRARPLFAGVALAAIATAGILVAGSLRQEPETEARPAAAAPAVTASPTPTPDARAEQLAAERSRRAAERRRRAVERRRRAAERRRRAAARAAAVPAPTAAPVVTAAPTAAPAPAKTPKKQAKRPVRTPEPTPDRGEAPTEFVPPPDADPCAENSPDCDSG